MWFWSAPEGTITRHVEMPKGTSLFLTIRDAEIRGNSGDHFTRRCQLRLEPHAAARVDQHGDRQRGRRVDLKCEDRRRLAVVAHLEVGCFQRRDRSSTPVTDDGADGDDGY